MRTPHGRRGSRRTDVILPEAEQYAAAEDVLKRRRVRAWLGNHSRFDNDDYMLALEGSPMSKPEKTTLRVTAETVNPDGFTAVDRMTVAMGTEQGEKTVTRHWKAARSLGLLEDRRRFNRTSVQVAIVPGSGHGFPDHWVISTPLGGCFWTQELTDWWASHAVPGQQETPWGEGPPPF